MKNEKQTMSQMLKTRASGIRMSKPGQQEKKEPSATQEWNKSTVAT